MHEYDYVVYFLTVPCFTEGFLWDIVDNFLVVIKNVHIKFIDVRKWLKIYLSCSKLKICDIDDILLNSQCTGNPTHRKAVHLLSYPFF